MSNFIKQELQRINVEKAMAKYDPSAPNPVGTGKTRLKKAIAQNLADSSGKIGDKSRKYQDRGAPPSPTSGRIPRGQSSFRAPEYSTATIDAYREISNSQNSGVIGWLNSRGASLTIPLSGGSGFTADRFSVDAPSKATPTTFLKTAAYEDI